MAESPTGVRGRIFISYRREDAAYPAGWLFDRLAERFGNEQIFKDVDSIELGDDFVEVIGEAVGASDVLLAFIGDRWLTVTDEHGGRRLDDPNDFVRIEIEAALQRKVRVIPILVEGASMPHEEQLPPSLAPLARRHALELSPARFSSDTSRLLRVLESTLAEPAPSAETPPAPELPEQKEHAERMPATNERAPRRTRPIVVTLALAGAALGLFANGFPGNEPIGSLAAYAPETLGVPVLVAVAAVLLQAGRLPERLAYGALLGFGILTTAGAIGIGTLSTELDLGQSSAAIALLAAGALVLAAGLLGAARDVRAADAWRTPFRWSSASLLTVLGAVVGVAALLVPFGRSIDDSQAMVVYLGDSGFTGLALEPIVAVATACVGAYVLGKGSTVRLLAAGVVLALGAQTILFYGSLVGTVESNYGDAWKPGLGVGCFLGLAAGALLAAAGVVGRRSTAEQALRPATTS